MRAGTTMLERLVFIVGRKSYRNVTAACPVVLAEEPQMCPECPRGMRWDLVCEPLHGHSGARCPFVPQSRSRDGLLCAVV